MNFVTNEGISLGGSSDSMGYHWFLVQIGGLSMVSGLWMGAVSDIKVVTSVECEVGYCMRFALIFVKIWEIVSCVEIPVLVSSLT